jgi:2-oxoglutarate dehydrogenase E2 component (dihydrolipoamide succinyltransferase)
MAEEHKLDLTQIDGTGKNGRITKRDVTNHLETINNEQLVNNKVKAGTPPPTTEHPSPISYSPSPVPHPSSPDFLPHSSLRRSIADHMVLSKKTSPHVTTIFEADFSAVWAHRAANKADFASKGVKLTFTPYIILAITRALQLHSQVNSSWQDDGLLLHKSINIGMATAIKQGLIVPVIKGADGFNLLGMARAVNDLAERARDNKLKPAEVSGGTFTLTNHGTSGSLFATPIINQPQCGILGVGAIQKRVVVITDEFGNDAMVIRPMAYLSFSFDHRILDGASADHFVAEIKRVLEAWV